MKKTITLLLSITCLYLCFAISTPIGLQANNPTNTTSPTTDKGDDPTLFSYGKEDVSKSEFVYVYEKHNAQDSNKYSRKSIDEYLDLYINFKLKVKEAESLGIDTVKAIQAQLDQYRKQLAQNYLHDKDISEELIGEAYDHMKKEVRTSHILIMCKENALPNDTTVAFKKASSIYKLITEKGEPFTKMARKYSEDPSVSDNNGDLGYITAFQTVYPFEKAAYTTPVGEISQPIRSKYGYHLIKVDDMRPTRGKIQAAHILVKSNEKDSAEDKATAAAKIKALYKKAKKKSTDFAALAKDNSQDKSSAAKGGELPWFGSGTMLAEFENVSFNLKKGQVSEPFKTSIGWHIVKLLDRQKIGSYEEVKPEISKKIERDGRAKVSKVVFLNRLKKDYQFKENAKAKTALFEKIDDKLVKNKWTTESLPSNMNDELFSLKINAGDKKKNISVSQQEFSKHLVTHQVKDLSRKAQDKATRLYQSFVEKKLVEAEESVLEHKHPEFARLMQEFRDGNLLYELMGEKVWNKAMQDTLGLQKFYETNKDSYVWKERAEAHIFYFKDEITAKTQRKALKDLDKAGVEAIQNELKKTGVRIETGNYEKDQNKILNQVAWKAGTSEIITNPDGSIAFVKVYQLLAAGPKQLSEARGYVIADYQSQLEKEWIGELRKKYPVKVNDKVLKSIYQ